MLEFYTEFLRNRKEMKAVGLLEVMDIKGGPEQVLRAKKNKVRLGVEKPWPLPLTAKQKTLEFISSSANQA